MERWSEGHLDDHYRAVRRTQTARFEFWIIQSSSKCLQARVHDRWKRQALGQPWVCRASFALQICLLAGLRTGSNLMDFLTFQVCDAILDPPLPRKNGRSKKIGQTNQTVIHFVPSMYVSGKISSLQPGTQTVIIFGTTKKENYLKTCAIELGSQDLDHGS